MIVARKQSGSFNPCKLVETLGNAATFELHDRIAIQWNIYALKVVACFQGPGVPAISIIKIKCKNTAYQHRLNI